VPDHIQLVPEPMRFVVSHTKTRKEQPRKPIGAAMVSREETTARSGVCLRMAT